MILGKGRNKEELLKVLSMPALRVHFSQFGEDCMLWNAFREKKNGFYVDVGCHDPYRFSNTCLLHEFLGWRGINIDADAQAIARFAQARPSDININCGVGATEETRRLAVFEGGAVNTFQEGMAGQQADKFKLKEHVEVQVRPLRAILDDNLPVGTEIDYLNVDCEGLDEEVLHSNDWSKYRPKIVTVEIHGLKLETPLSNPCVQLMKAVGYRMRSHYHPTTIFQRA